MMNKLVSIIIPIYNQAEIISLTVDSILNQSYKNLEVIIVNDGSTDNILSIIDEIGNKIQEAGYNFQFINQNNAGAPTARNVGFNKSTGDYVIFLDADTIMEKNMIEDMVFVLDNNQTISYVYSGLKYGWKKFNSRTFDPDILKINNYIDTSSLIRRIDFPGFDISLKRFQDWDLWLTMLEKNKIGFYLPKILYKKITIGRPGMSRWLPSIVYRLPFKIEAVRRYEAAKDIVRKKHQLN